MKRTKMLCSITSVLMAVLLIALSVSAPIGALDTLTTSNEDKIDSTLKEKLETMSGNDTVKVSVWFDDIDYDEVKNRAEKVLNSNTRAINVSQSAIDLAFYDVENTTSNSEMSAYVLNDTYSDVTTEEMKVVIEAERFVASEMYQEHNQSIINDIISDSQQMMRINRSSLQIDYVCRYAPNADMTLTKEQILNVADSDDVTEINYIETPTDAYLVDVASDDFYDEEDEPYDMTFFNVTGLATARDAWGLDGRGMNVGMIEANGHPMNFDSLNVIEEVYSSANNLVPKLHAYSVK